MKLTLLVHTEAAMRASDMKALGGQLTLAREAAGRLRRLEDESVANGPLNIRVKEAGAAPPPPMPLASARGAAGPAGMGGDEALPPRLVSRRGVAPAVCRSAGVL